MYNIGVIIEEKRVSKLEKGVYHDANDLRILLLLFLPKRTCVIITFGLGLFDIEKDNS